MSWLPRKVVHISGAAFAFIALYSNTLSLAIALAVLAVFFLLEALKPHVGPAYLSVLYRDSERKGVASEPLLYLLCIATLLALALVFLPPICYASIIVLTFGDGIAGIVGKSFGKHRLPYSTKTWEGSLAGFIAASAVGFIFAGPLAIAGAAAGMAAEAYSERLENLSVATVSFLAMAILHVLL